MKRIYTEADCLSDMGKLWCYLAVNPDIQSKVLGIRHCFERGELTKPSYHMDCPCCEYVVLREPLAMIMPCWLCPLLSVWTSQGKYRSERPTPCERSESMWLAWCRASDNDGRRHAASSIAVASIDLLNRLTKKR